MTDAPISSRPYITGEQMDDVDILRNEASRDLLAVAESVVAWAATTKLDFELYGAKIKEPLFVAAARAAIAKAKGVAE